MTKIVSTVMEIEVVGRTVRYRYHTGGGWYEIRDVSAYHLSGLDRTIRDARFSSGATVAYFTHCYPRSHRREDGSIAPPHRESKRSLVKKTSFFDG